ncbi:endonuclease [Escherichia coli]|nr:endonuclease [Escherichia coli]
MRKYIPLVLFIFSWPVLCADIHRVGSLAAAACHGLKLPL